MSVSSQDWEAYSKCDNMGSPWNNFRTEAKVRTRAQVKLLVESSKIPFIGEYSNFRKLVTEIVTYNKVFKSHLIMAIVERHLLNQSEAVDYSCGIGKAHYDHVDAKVQQLVYNDILEPHVTGQPLKMKVQGGVIEPRKTRPKSNTSVGQASRAVQQLCSECFGFDIACQRCGGRGSYAVAVPDTSNVAPRVHEGNIMYSYESAPITKDEWDRLGIKASLKRRKHKKYTIRNEELSMKAHKRQRTKYTGKIRKEELI